jgi:hypothetical protein
MNRDEILSGASRPYMPPIELENIPQAIRECPRWVTWNWAKRDGKWSKPPNAMSNLPETWTTYEEVVASYQSFLCDGIGFMLGDGWAGVDLDDCRNSDGELSPVAQDVIATLDAYTEISPTGTGVKILLRGKTPDGPRKSADHTVEVYDSGRYFTVTGRKLSGDIADRQEGLEAVYRKHIERPKAQHGPVATCSHVPALDAMLRILPKGDEKDGSNRLFAWACRAVEHNLSDEIAVKTIREAETHYPFPRAYDDAAILQRIRHAEKKAERGSARRSIVMGSDFPALVVETIDALAKSSSVYQHAGILTTVSLQPEKCKYAKVDNGAPRLALLPKDGMLEKLTEAADFYAYDGKTKRWKPSWPKAELRNAIWSRGVYPGVPVIYGVVTRPILLPDGSVITDAGYHTESGLYLHIDGEWPAIMSIETAVEKLRDVWCDFPFASPASEAGAFAALLTMLCRRNISGNTPLFVVDGNRSRVGKGLLSDTWTMIVEARRASRYSMSNQDELRKFLTSLGTEGGEYVLFDNITGRFGGPTLEAAMTTGTINDRVLGISKTVDVPLSLTWLATGNGYTPTKDMVGRSIPIMLDTELANPESRGGFKHPELLAYIQQNRRELVMAGLSIVANYIRAGSPKQDIENFGGFENWSDLIRGAIVYAGLADPLDERQQLVEASDDGVALKTKELINAWTFAEPTNVKNALEAVASGTASVELASILDECPKEAKPSEYLGKLLRSAKGQPVGGRKFDRTAHKVAKWFVTSA